MNSLFHIKPHSKRSHSEMQHFHYPKSPNIILILWNKDKVHTGNKKKKKKKKNLRNNL